eukprot:775357-Pelagomonas_calceolata.AAC.3
MASKSGTTPALVFTATEDMDGQQLQHQQHQQQGVYVDAVAGRHATTDVGVRLGAHLARLSTGCFVRSIHVGMPCILVITGDMYIHRRALKAWSASVGHEASPRGEGHFLQSSTCGSFLLSLLDRRTCLPDSPTFLASFSPASLIA